MMVCIVQIVGMTKIQTESGRILMKRFIPAFPFSFGFFPSGEMSINPSLLLIIGLCNVKGEIVWSIAFTEVSDEF